MQRTRFDIFPLLAAFVVAWPVGVVETNLLNIIIKQNSFVYIVI